MNIDFGVELAPLDSSEMERVRAWRNDYRIYRWCRQSDVISDVQQRAWFERQHADSTIKMYAVKTRFEGKKETVGVCGLTSIDWLNRHAEFSLYIGPEYHRKGLGREALKLLLLHAFSNLGLEQIWGESMDQNPATKVFEALGFKKDGTRRRFYWKDGAFHDAHLYSILREEWLIGHRRSGVDSGAVSPDLRGSGGAAPALSMAKAPKRRLRENPKPAAEPGKEKADSDDRGAAMATGAG